MALFYQTNSWTSQPQPSKDQVEAWKHIADKKNWRIVELANGFFQTEYQEMNQEGNWIDATRRESINEAEKAIDSTVVHYSKKVEFVDGPKVVKTFK